MGNSSPSIWGNASLMAVAIRLDCGRWNYLAWRTPVRVSESALGMEDLVSGDFSKNLSERNSMLVLICPAAYKGKVGMCTFLGHWTELLLLHRGCFCSGYLFCLRYRIGNGQESLMSEKKFLGNTKEVVSQRGVAKEQSSFCSYLSDMYSFLEMVNLRSPAFGKQGMRRYTERIQSYFKKSLEDF